jgi:hypothetical protein
MDEAPQQITQILEAVGAGYEQAAEQLLPLVYEGLRRLAAFKMSREAPARTFQPKPWRRRLGCESPASKTGIGIRAIIFYDLSRGHAADSG